MSDIPLNDGFFSIKSSSEEKSSTIKFFRLRVKNKTFKNHTHINYSENYPHIEQKKKQKQKKPLTYLHSHCLTFSLAWYLGFLLVAELVNEDK